MRNDDQLNRREAAETKRGGMMIVAVIIALAIAALITWVPWNGNEQASNSAPGTTVGQSRPEAPSAPSGQRPEAPGPTR
jgi:flagellar basal body-associated protein FliL